MNKQKTRLSSGKGIALVGICVNTVATPPLRKCRPTGVGPIVQAGPKLYGLQLRYERDSAIVKVTKCEGSAASQLPMLPIFEPDARHPDNANALVDTDFMISAALYPPHSETNDGKV
jgi:hypothetical protein